jgi:4-amino-4-deoxy-L-arabinose transferase-like glycosyltransferase
MDPNARSLSPRGTALLLLLTAALLVLRTGALPLVGPDEPRYARVAVEMHRAGSWVRPTLQGQPWLEKPPLYYWLAGAAFGLLGENETAARLPSVAATLLLVGITALVGARLYGRSAGLHAGFILATSLLVFLYGHGANMDMLLAATVTGAVGLLALDALRVAGRLAVPAAWAFMGLAVLAKGPLGVALPGLVVAGYAAIARDGAFLRRVLRPTGITVFLLIAAPWYAAILRDQGARFVEVFLLNHNLQRFTSEVHHHAGPFYYYLPVVIAGLVPWSGLLVPAALLAGRAPQHAAADRFLLVWLALPFVFFSAAGSKLPGYILPCLPPLALLMGRATVGFAAGQVARGLARAAAVVGLVLASGIAAAPVALAWRGDPAWRLALPPAAWALLTAFVFSLHAERRPAAALRLLRVGAPGLLVLLALAAPPLVARDESGRALFAPAAGREVLAWRAWRTAWMAGYFYNDGRVREVESLAEIAEAAGRAPVLVVCGPGERQQIAASAWLRAQVLAHGPRGHVLLEVVSVTPSPPRTG